MAKKADAKKARGVFEFDFEFAPVDGEKFVLTTTPSQWGRADEWADNLFVTCTIEHSQGWFGARMMDCLALYALMDGGYMPQGPVTLDRIWEMNSRFPYENITPEADSGDREEEGNPTEADGA